MMDTNNTPSLIQLTTIATNLGIILVGFRIIRHLARMELKVEMMWGVFIRRFGERNEKGDNGEDE